MGSNGNQKLETALQWRCNQEAEYGRNLENIRGFSFWVGQVYKLRYPKNLKRN